MTEDKWKERQLVNFAEKRADWLNLSGIFGTHGYSPENVRKAARIFLTNNPQVLADIDETQTRTGADIVFAVVPRIGLILGRCGTELRAVFPEIMCTKSAMGLLIPKTSPGYDIFSPNSEYPLLRDGLIQEGLSRNEISSMPVYGFDDKKDAPQNYIAAQLEGCLIENQHTGDDLENVLLRHHYPQDNIKNPSVVI